MMARIRSLKPDIWEDEKFGLLPAEARLLFIGLISQSDDEGYQRGNPAVIKARVFPYDPYTTQQVQAWLDDLQAAHLITQYGSKDGSQKYLRIDNWLKHQRVDSPRASKFPTPNGKYPKREPKNVHENQLNPTDFHDPLTKQLISRDFREEPQMDKDKDKDRDKDKEPVTARDARTREDGVTEQVTEGLPLKWVQECADVMCPVLTGVDRNTLTQTLADAQVYGQGVRSRQRYPKEVFVTAAHKFADALGSGKLQKPDAWWNYYCGILHRVNLSGEAVDGEQATAQAEGKRIQENIQAQLREIYGDEYDAEERG
jgi:hypothetical protein